MNHFSIAQGIKEQYQDKNNNQNTVIVKADGVSDIEILNLLDIDDYSVGQEIKITTEMLLKIKEKYPDKVKEIPIVISNVEKENNKPKNTSLIAEGEIKIQKTKPITERAASSKKKKISKKKSKKKRVKNRKPLKRKRVKRKKTRRQIFNFSNTLGCYRF